MEKFSVLTADNYRIAATRFVPENPNGNVIVICSATGIKQRFYAGFAAKFAAQGYTVYTYDYRGIGLSKPDKISGFQATMRDWATKDFQAITDFVTDAHPNARKFHIGHSIGGIFIGLTPAYKQYDAFVTVAAQFGYWKNFYNKNKPAVLWFFYVLVPVLSKMLGYFPSKVKSMGESLPVGVAKDWRTLIVSKKSAMALAEQSYNFYEKIDKPVLVISLEDDWIAPEKAVDIFVQKMLKNAKVERKHILLSEAKTKAIGHVNFFRNKFEKNLWNIPLNWLETV
ncbi:alpha/beta hydrolase family protein [Flexibacter flexilis]|nr:alpha/beta fold hydrolase [Flexibacter flexilis]